MVSKRLVLQKTDDLLLENFWNVIVHQVIAWAPVVLHTSKHCASSGLFLPNFVQLLFFPSNFRPRARSILNSVASSSLILLRPVIRDVIVPGESDRDENFEYEFRDGFHRDEKCEYFVTKIFGHRGTDERRVSHQGSKGDNATLECEWKLTSAGRRFPSLDRKSVV